jgi:cell division protein FtsL
MTKRTVVIRRNTCTWQPKTKRKIEPILSAPKVRAAGFISPVLVVLACTAFSGLFYIYSVNQTAVKGIAIRSAEQEIAKQQKENGALKIREAELKSLYNIEENSKQLNMSQATNVKYLEESPSVAYGITAR